MTILFDVKECTSKNLIVSFNSADINRQHHFNSDTILFENFKRLKKYEANVLFVKSTIKDWYLQDIQKIINEINSVVQKLQIERIVCIGISMGGFAALLYSTFLDRCVGVLAFSPQICMNNHDFFSKFQYNLLYETDIDFSKLENSQFTNLQNFMNNTEIRYHIFYGSQNFDDSNHISLLPNLDNITLHKFDSNSHSAPLDILLSTKTYEYVIYGFFHTLFNDL